jgi:hypothetical protein
VTDTCGVTGPPQLLFVTMNVENYFGTSLSGYIHDDDFDWFSEDVTGIAAYPFWSMTTGSCAVSTLGGRCGAVVALLEGLPVYFSDDPLPEQVNGAIEYRWTNPACTTRWEGYWER